MRLFKVKAVKTLLKIKKSTIKKILRSRGMITASWAVIDSQGCVVELHEYNDGFIETTLLITSRGLDMIEEEVNHG